ncbi:MAG: TonB-dependent receptor [Bacteroidales bacterium]|nr:TonB-dependent receptor [Bacteroidales bacterium]
MTKRLFILCFFTATGLFSTIFAQRNFTLSGTIKDQSNGEILIGASVLVRDGKGGITGAVTNVYGFYSISLPGGEYSLTFSFIGYESQEKTISLTQNTTLSLELKPAFTTLSEVVITEQRSNQRITRNEMSVVKMNIQAIRQIPTLMGEVDVIKAIQLLPGVMATSEGGSGFSVRGGAPDQNLILLDEATVYNAAHALGFFSVFNNDAIKDVTIYKGDIPVQFGGRLSSVLDVRMNDGNTKRFEATGGIGILSSRLTVEGPIFKDQTSFLLAGRRTYFDLFLPLSNNAMARNVRLYFYDLNGKIVHRFSDKSRLYLSAYNGLDVFGIRLGEYMQFDYGNTTLTARWNYLFSPKLFSNLTGVFSKYDYTTGAEIGNMRFKWLAGLSDYGGKMDFTYFPNPKNTVRFGASSVYHVYRPGFSDFYISSGTGWFADSASVGQRMELADNHALENAIYVGNDQTIDDRFSLKYGIRLSSFSNIGRDTVYYYDDDFNVIDIVGYQKGRFFYTHWGFEPRIGATYVINEATSVKGNYSRTVQYVQLAQTSTGGNPLDMWFPANPNIKPQKADMYALGLFRNFQDNKWETSLEFYYKDIFNCIDFKDHSNVIMNTQLYGEIRQGRGKAYGMEVMIKRPSGTLNGWVSYTLSRSERTISAINDGKTYLAPFDRTHNLSIVANYRLSERHSFSANWVFYTGNAVTFPTGAAVIGGEWLPVYSDRNDSRMPNYHRLDVSYTLKSRPNPQRRWSYDWNFGLFNAYGRKNPWVINFKEDRQHDRRFAEMTYLFGVIPSITFNFKF